MNASAETTPGAGTGFAPGKLILVGEHAVVHGAPALALPFASIGAVASVSPAAGPLELDTPVGQALLASAEDAPPRMRGLARAAFGALEALGAPAEGLSVRVDATIPIGCGLGSSAAVAIAIVRAIFAAFGREAEASTLLALADVAERVAHGNPSGLDAHTVAAAGPIWFRRGVGAVPVAVGAAMHLVVADTGKPGDTGAAVAGVSARLEADPEAAQAAIATLGVLALEARQALEAGEAEALGAVLNQAQAQLASLGVSHPSLEALIASARGAGALGAKLTGAGQGGCAIALAPDEDTQRQVAQAMRQAGARAVWTLTLDSTESEATGG